MAARLIRRCALSDWANHGGRTIVKDYVREHRRRTREVLVPLRHSPKLEVLNEVAQLGVKFVETSGNVAKATGYRATDCPRSSCHRWPGTTDWTAL